MSGGLLVLVGVLVAALLRKRSTNPSLEDVN